MRQTRKQLKRAAEFAEQHSADWERWAKDLKRALTEARNDSRINGNLRLQADKEADRARIAQAKAEKALAKIQEVLDRANGAAPSPTLHCSRPKTHREVRGTAGEWARRVAETKVWPYSSPEPKIEVYFAGGPNNGKTVIVPASLQTYDVPAIPPTSQWCNRALIDIDCNRALIGSVVPVKRHHYKITRHIVDGSPRYVAWYKGIV